MSGLYRDQGVVLRSIKLGEADRIVTILTPGHGKVRAVAKGVRRTASRFGARLDATSHVALQCYRGRELDVVTQAETLDSFRPLRDDYTLLTHALSMLEAVDQVSPEHEPSPGRYRMLVGALRTLSTTPSPAVAGAFFWKLLSMEGFQPYMDGCVRCGEEQGPFPAFDLEDGGLLCTVCGRLGGRRVDPEAVELLRTVVGGGVRHVMANPPPVMVIRDVERLGVAALEHHSERRLRSAALL